VRDLIKEDVVVAFIALYSGETANSAQLIALSSDQTLVGDVAGRLVKEREPAIHLVLKEPEAAPSAGPVDDATPHEEERDGSHQGYGEEAHLAV
jgi:hypothetical protein